MISDKMIATMQEIQDMQKDIGIAKAPDIETYRDEATLYRSLNRLEQLGLIQQYKAPSQERLTKTYKLTELGQKLLNNAKKLRKQRRQ